MTPEMIKYLKNYRNKQIPTFNDYFNKHYYGEISEFYKNVKFSLNWKSMMIMNNIQNIVRRKIMNDYLEKYPNTKVEEDYTLHPKNIENIKSIDNSNEEILENPTTPLSTHSIDSESYDMVDITPTNSPRSLTPERPDTPTPPLPIDPLPIAQNKQLTHNENLSLEITPIKNSLRRSTRLKNKT